MHCRNLASLHAAAFASLALATSCGTEDFTAEGQTRTLAAEHNVAAAPEQPYVDNRVHVPTGGAFADGYVVSLTGASLDENAWLRRGTRCSKVRNACVDANAELSQLDGNGALVLRTSAAEAGDANAAATPARYPSLDLIDPNATFTHGCIELVAELPSHAASYGGFVLAPADAPAQGADANGFLGQVWLLSATNGSLHVGLACRDDGGSLAGARPADPNFLATAHHLRFCADGDKARWEVDGKVWADFEAAELPPACGAWPFGPDVQPMHVHVVLAPQAKVGQGAPADQMTLHGLAIDQDRSE